MRARLVSPSRPWRYAYYPAQWLEPYLGLRRELGWSLYGKLGIRKGDRAASRRWQDQNFTFFGTPVGKPKEKQRAAIAAWSAMIGAIVLARLVDDETLSKEILSATRASLPLA